MTLYEIIREFYSGRGPYLSDADKKMGLSCIRRYIACDYPDIAQELNVYNSPSVATANVFAILLMTRKKMPSYLKFTGDTIDFENKKNLINAFEANYKDISLLAKIDSEKFQNYSNCYKDIELQKKKEK